MGYMRHHAVVVTSGIKTLIDSAYGKAKQIGCAVTEVVESPVNGYYSFLIASDGSKEGWDESDIGDRRRADFAVWANAQAYGDGSNSLGFVEVMYHDERHAVEIVHDDGEMMRKKPIP